MNEYLEKLKEKYNYDETIMNMLSSIIPALITYFGTEYKSIILDAIMNCEIHIGSLTENANSYLNSYFNETKEKNIPITAGAFYHKNIKFVNGKLESKSIVYIRNSKREPLTIDNNKLDSIVHELCHAIKGYKKEKLIDGIPYDSTGLNKEICEISNGSIEIKESLFLGIEEAINTVTSAKICELITGTYELKSYGRAGRIAELLLNNDKFKDIIIKSEFNDSNEWIDYLGIDNAKLLCNNIDELVNAMYVPYSEINTKDKLKAYKERVNKIYNETYEFLENYLKERGL